MDTRRWRLAGALAILALAVGCAVEAPPTAGATRPAQASGELAPLVVHTTLVYARPLVFTAVTRPTGFGVIRDYRSSTALETFVGAWNDASQTLTADFDVQLKAENLVYVDDPAVTPGSPTPMRSGRSGSLDQITCPENVPAERVCYLLQILH